MISIFDSLMQICGEIESIVCTAIKWQSVSNYIDIRSLQIDKVSNFRERLMVDTPRQSNIVLTHEYSYKNYCGIAHNSTTESIVSLSCGSMGINKKNIKEKISDTS